MEQADLLVIGAHPDDVEICMGGTIAKHVRLGYKAGILDLTRGEMGANGTPEQRLLEGEKAKLILGCIFRKNLGLPDGRVEHNKTNVAQLVEIIRKVKPRLIFSPYYDDKHHDHVACAKIVSEAFFASSLSKFSADSEPHRPSQLIFYMMRTLAIPSFIVDISDYYHLKKQAVLAHRSQFFRDRSSVETELNKEDGYPEMLEVRDKSFGMQIGAAYGEGFIIKDILPVANLFNIWARGQ